MCQLIIDQQIITWNDKQLTTKLSTLAKMDAELFWLGGDLSPYKSKPDNSCFSRLWKCCCCKTDEVNTDEGIAQHLNSARTTLLKLHAAVRHKPKLFKLYTEGVETFNRMVTSRSLSVIIDTARTEETTQLASPTSEEVARKYSIAQINAFSPTIPGVVPPSTPVHLRVGDVAARDLSSASSPDELKTIGSLAMPLQQQP